MTISAIIRRVNVLCQSPATQSVTVGMSFSSLEQV